MSRLKFHKGSCLCQDVTFEVEGGLPAASACHCTKCRKHTGNFEAGADVPRSANIDLEISKLKLGEKK